MSFSNPPNIDKLEVGATLPLAGVFLGICNEPVEAKLMEKSEKEAVFDLLYFQIPIGTLYANKTKGAWTWEC